jgi:hypothetical protein
MKSIIHALNDSYRVTANAAEAIADICGNIPQAQFLVDMMFNCPSYDSLTEEWYNETMRKYGEPRLQLFFSSMDGKQVLDLCELHYLLTVLEARDLWDVVIESVENVLKGV